MSGYTPLQPGDNANLKNAEINAMNSEQYGAMAEAMFTVANQTALSAIPSYYKVTGKIVRCMDSDGLGTIVTYSWNGTSWVAVPFVRTIGVPVASAASIAITGDIFHVTGIIQINTITGSQSGQEIVLIPDAAFTLGTSGNIAIASAAVIGKAMALYFDGTKWFPNY
jgi:hypothetical protein